MGNGLRSNRDGYEIHSLSDEKKMTPAQKRDTHDKQLAEAVEIAALKFLHCIGEARANGLHVNSNVGTSYEKIGGFVEVHRPLKRDCLKVMSIKNLNERQK